MTMGMPTTTGTIIRTAKRAVMTMGMAMLTAMPMPMTTVTITALNMQVVINQV